MDGVLQVHLQEAWGAGLLRDRENRLALPEGAILLAVEAFPCVVTADHEIRDDGPSFMELVSKGAGVDIRFLEVFELSDLAFLSRGFRPPS